MSSILDIREKIAKIIENLKRQGSFDTRIPLEILFLRAVEESLGGRKDRSIDVLNDTMIINFVIAASSEDFSSYEIKQFFEDLSNEKVILSALDELEDLDLELFDDPENS